jgi:serine/threonine protein phosphatase PrpC
MKAKSAIQPHFFVESDLPEPEVVELEGGAVVVYSARGPGKDVNHDSAAIVPFAGGGCALLIADGLGGQPCAERASCLAIEALAKTLDKRNKEGGGVREAIINGLELANTDILTLGIGAGTTMAIAAITGGAVRATHVGDSMVLVVGQRGTQKLLTVAHSPTGYAVEAGLMDEEEALFHEERHLVSNIVGHTSMRIEVGSSVPLAQRDTVLVASDGLADNMSTQEIVEAIRKGPIERAARTLFEVCRYRMDNPTDGQPSKPDDLSFVLYRQNA